MSITIPPIKMGVACTVGNERRCDVMTDSRLAYLQSVESCMTNREIRELMVEITCLRAEVEAARKDAARYRWLRSDNACELGEPWCVTRFKKSTIKEEVTALHHEQLDALVDAAIARESRHDYR